MDEPLITAQRSCENERDAISREKQIVLEQRNRWESDVAITKENIEKLELEASRKWNAR
jgi:flagellar motility protein MotE (MotC chaperone)